MVLAELNVLHILRHIAPKICCKFETHSDLTTSLGVFTRTKEANKCFVCDQLLACFQHHGAQSLYYVTILVWVAIHNDQQYYSYCMFLSIWKWLYFLHVQSLSVTAQTHLLLGKQCPVRFTASSSYHAQIKHANMFGKRPCWVQCTNSPKRLRRCPFGLNAQTHLQSLGKRPAESHCINNWTLLECPSI